VGGEVAVQQQLSLDLTVDREPQTHYDSGLVQGGRQLSEHRHYDLHPWDALRRHCDGDQGQSALIPGTLSRKYSTDFASDRGGLKP